MSKALFNNLGGLRFWNETELLRRDNATKELFLMMRVVLMGVNPAWKFVQCESPMLIPENFLATEYHSSKDIFELKHKLGDKVGYLRPETTSGSYQVMNDILQSTKNKLPLTVWQVGKSFRREVSDGSSAAKFRYNEFTQLEFQCCYSV